MKLKDIDKTELEQMSYADLSYIILKENKKPMNTPNLFKKICELLEYSDEVYNEKIGDFYTLLTTDKRFLFLDSSEWDLRENHIVKMEIDEDEELDEEEIEEDEEENLEEVEEDIDSESLDDDLDDTDDLTIISENDIDSDEE